MVFLFFSDISRAQGNPASIFELSGGEMVFSQNAQFYYGQIGDLIPLPSLSSLSSTGKFPYLHVFVAGNVISFAQPAVDPSEAINGITYQSYEGIIPAVGIQIPTSWGFWEGDLGGAFFQVDQTYTPVQSVDGIYAQMEVYLASVGPGGLDLFGSYIGEINYLFGMGRYLIPVGTLGNGTLSFYAGPEGIAQGDNAYFALQGGGVLSAYIRPIHTILTLEGGILNSSAWPGIGGYEGLSFYVSY